LSSNIITTTRLYDISGENMEFKRSSDGVHAVVFERNEFLNLRKDNRELSETYEQLRVEHEELTNDYLQLSQDFVNMKKSMTVMESQNEQLLRTVEILSMECDTLRNKLQDKHREIPDEIEHIKHSMREKLRNAALEREGLQKRVSDLELESSKMELYVKRVRKEMSSSLNGTLSSGLKKSKVVSSTSFSAISSFKCDSDLSRRINNTKFVGNRSSSSTLYEDFNGTNTSATQEVVSNEMFSSLKKRGRDSSFDFAFALLKEKLGYENGSLDRRNETWNKHSAVEMECDQTITNCFIDMMKEG